MPNTRFLFGYVFMICILGVYVYFSGAIGALMFLFALSFYSIISYAVHKIWKYMRNKPALYFLDFLRLFIYKVSLYASIVLIFFGSFMYYQNSISPAMMPQYTISNGKQTIVFQAMSHIASREFYSKVQRDIRGYKQQGYVLYFEGVKPGNEKNSEDFNNALGINFEPELYDNFSKLYGVVAQNNDDFLNLENNLDYNIDIDINEIMDIYREKTASSSSSNKKSFLQSREVQDVNALVLDQLTRLNEKQLTALRYINQSLLNFMIKQEGLRNIIVEKVANQDLFSVILDGRNQHIANEIEKRGDKEIFILYGLMHFQGVFDLLKSQDPNWQINGTSYSQLITRSQ